MIVGCGGIKNVLQENPDAGVKGQTDVMDVVVGDREVASEFLGVTIDIAAAGPDSARADIVDVIADSGAVAASLGKLQCVEAHMLNRAVGESTFACASEVDRAGHEGGGLSAAIGVFAVEVLMRNRWRTEGRIPVGMTKGQAGKVQSTDVACALRIAGVSGLPEKRTAGMEEGAESRRMDRGVGGGLPATWQIVQTPGLAIEIPLAGFGEGFEEIVDVVAREVPALKHRLVGFEKAQSGAAGEAEPAGLRIELGAGESFIDPIMEDDGLGIVQAVPRLNIIGFGLKGIVACAEVGVLGVFDFADAKHVVHVLGLGGELGQTCAGGAATVDEEGAEFPIARRDFGQVEGPLGAAIALPNFPTGELLATFENRIGPWGGSISGVRVLGGELQGLAKRVGAVLDLHGDGTGDLSVGPESAQIVTGSFKSEPRLLGRSRGGITTAR